MNTPLKIFAFVHSTMFAINAAETVLIANDLQENDFFIFERDDHHDISGIYPKKCSYSDGCVTLKILGTTGDHQTKIAPYLFSKLGKTEKDDDVKYSDSFALRVIFEKSENRAVRLPSDCRRMFSESPISAIDISGIDSTAYITNMQEMFENCERLGDLDLRNLNTSKVTDMSYMFSGCDNLKNINLQNFDTSNVTNMCCMFSDSGVETLDLSHFDTHNVTNMASMFSKCTKLQKLNLKKI